MPIFPTSILEQMLNLSLATISKLQLLDVMLSSSQLVSQESQVNTNINNIVAYENEPESVTVQVIIYYKAYYNEILFY